MRRPVSVKTFLSSFLFFSLSASFISSFSKLSPFGQAVAVATLPSALFVERLPLGASWVYLIQSFRACGPRKRMKDHARRTRLFNVLAWSFDPVGADIQPRINKETCWLQKRLQIGSDEFRIGLHLTKDATQRPGQFLLVRKVSIVSSCLARVSPQSLSWIQLR